MPAETAGVSHAEARHSELRPETASDPGVLPRHVAIIMDGNGRWAVGRGLPRTEGHRKGVDAVRRTVRAVGETGIPYLTLFGFSSENWSRPQREVSFLMDLLRGYIRRDLDDLREGGVRVRVLGARDNLPDDIASLVAMAEDTTADNTKLNLQVAFNYGGRDEIVRAARRIAADAAAGRLDPEAVNETVFERYLDTHGLPEPDVLIRTSGEQRLSNFLLWQCAYAEFVFVDEYWPDFDAACLDRALKTYAARGRRFGGLASGS